MNIASIFSNHDFCSKLASSCNYETIVIVYIYIYIIWKINIQWKSSIFHSLNLTKTVYSLKWNQFSIPYPFILALVKRVSQFLLVKALKTLQYIYDFAEEIAEFPPTYCRVKFSGSLIYFILWALSYRSFIKLNFNISGDDNAHVFIDMHKYCIKWEVCQVWLSRWLQF